VAGVVPTPENAVGDHFTSEPAAVCRITVLNPAAAEVETIERLVIVVDVAGTLAASAAVTWSIVLLTIRAPFAGDEQ
jgi:hypothetical protein